MFFTININLATSLVKENIKENKLKWKDKHFILTLSMTAQCSLGSDDNNLKNVQPTNILLFTTLQRLILNKYSKIKLF